MLFFLVVFPIPGLPRPTLHLANPITVSVTPLGLAALAKLLIAKKVIGLGLLGAKTAAITAAVGGNNFIEKVKSQLNCLRLNPKRAHQSWASLSSSSSGNKCPPIEFVWLG